MAPNVGSSTGVLNNEPDEDLLHETNLTKEPDKRKLQLVWRNIAVFVYLHLTGLYGVYLMITSAKWYTCMWAYFLYFFGGLGVTAGAHRLWAHKSYKAKWPLRLMLTFFNTIAFQDAVVDWARDHRVHHKFSETDADPHNAKRGFFFSHVGWLLCKKHPQVKEKGKGIDMSDLYADPILFYQKKYYLMLMPVICFVIPTFVPVYFWGESFGTAWAVNIFRYIFTLNATWLVNSVAHLYGGKPYDRFINPAESKSVAILALGEGWHNYHHTFPWDYKTSEMGKYSMNFTCAFIDLMSRIGWAYELKTVSPTIIRQRVERTGDGSHEVWGWGDKDQSKEEMEQATIINRKNA